MTFDDSIPFDEAIAIAKRKGLLPTNLSSAQLSQLSADLKRRAVFSARMDKASVLQVLQDNLTAIVSRQKDERDVYRSIPEAKAQLRESMFKAGVPLASTATKPIQDFYSDTRRALIVMTNVLDTLGFGQHVAGQDPAALIVAPAQELVRFSVPKGGEAAERDWPARWHDAMDSIGTDAEDGCTDPDEADGRMVALKNHPIWQALGEGAGGYDDSLGNPWPPFAFNSGMGLVDVTRAEAIDLEILEEGQDIEPETNFDLNENLEASVGKFSAGLQSALVGDGLKIVAGVLQLAANARRVEILRQRVRIRQMLHFIDAQELREAA